MLSSLREKILNVKQNVPLFHTEKDLKTKDSVNLYVGAEILQHFQNQWEELHNINEYNAKIADDLAQEIEDVSKNMSSNKENISLITHILSNSNLVTNITHCLDKIKDLYTISETIERDLINLENSIEECEFENLKAQHKYHLTQYQVRKDEMLENYKSSLEENHSKKIAEHESKKKVIMEERQKVFQDAFKSDLELYKSMGTLPEINQIRSQNGALLEEIQLDFDQNELDQFFCDSS